MGTSVTRDGMRCKPARLVYVFDAETNMLFLADSFNAFSNQKNPQRCPHLQQNISESYTPFLPSS